MEIKIITSYKEFLNLKNDWQTLWREDPEATIFQTWWWQKAWLEHYLPPCHQLYIVTAYRASKLCLLLPLSRYRQFNTYSFNFLGWPDADFLSILASPEFLTDNFIVKLLQQLASEGRLFFPSLPQGSRLTKLLLKLPSPASLTDDFPVKLLTKTQPLALRRTEKRIVLYQKRLANLGNWQVRELPLTELTVFLDAGFSWLRQRFGRTKEFYRRRQLASQNFYHHLLTTLLPQKLAKIYTLELNNIALANLVVFTCKKTYYSNLTSFNPAYYKYYPGLILFYSVVQQFLDDPTFTLLNLGRGQEAYKQNFANTESATVAYKTFRFSITAQIYQRNKQLKQFIKNKPALYRLARSVKKLWPPS